MLRKKKFMLFIALNLIIGTPPNYSLAAQTTEYNLPLVVVEGVRDTLPEEYTGNLMARGARIGILGNRDFMDTPFTINSYTSSTVNNFMARTVAEVAKNDPSVKFQYPSGTLMENYRIRNFTYNANNMTVNGLMGMAPYGSTPTEMVERVEVWHGPNAFANGINPGGEVAGNINLALKQAGYDPVRRFTLDYANDGQVGGHIDVGDRFGKNKELGVRINGVYRDGDTGVDGQSQKRRLASLGLDYTKDKSRTTLDAYYIKDEFDGAVASVYQMSGGISSAPKAGSGIKGLYGGLENKAIFLHEDYSFTKDTSAYASFGKSWAVFDGYAGGGNFLGVNPATGLGMLYLSNGKTWVDKTAWEAGVRTKFKTGTIKHEAVVGVSALKLDTGGGSSDFMLSGVNMYSPIFDHSLLPAFDGKTSKLQSVDVDGIALADTMNFGNDNFELTLGVRRQNVNQKAYSAGNVSSDYDKSKTTPMVGLVIKPWGDQVSFYGSYAEALKAGNIVPDSNIYRNKNQVFEPYVSKQTEFGVKWDNKKLANTLSFYQIKQVNTYQEIHNDGTRTFHADGEQKNKGIEWMFFGELTNNLRILGGTAYSLGEVTKSNANVGKTPWGMPKWSANAAVEWDTPWNKDLTLSARMLFTGKQYANGANTMEIPSSTTFDIGARYVTKINNSKVTFRAFVENVFDRDYWAGLRSDSVLFTGNGRTFKFSATFDI